MAESAQLVITRGPEPGTRFTLERPTIIAGRHPDSGIFVQHPQVSRRHARIVRRDDGWVIEDLDSTNGTFVNGTRLTGPHRLAKGDEVGLSEAVTLAFREREPARTDAPPVIQAAAERQGVQEQQTAPEPQPAPERQPSPPPQRHSPPAREAGPDHVRRTRRPASQRSAPRPTAPGPRRRRDWTWLRIAAGFVILLLIAVSALVLILGYLDLMPALFGGLLRGLNPVGLAA